jgi:hypothetical protein
MRTQSRQSTGTLKFQSWSPRLALNIEDLYRCPMSLQSELGLIERLLTLSKSCCSPTLKKLAPELKVRKRNLQSELEARSAEA